MTRRLLRSAFAAVLAIAAAGGVRAQETPTEPPATEFQATLHGYEEVPSISTAGTGTFKATINGEGATATIDYELTFTGLSGPANVAHVHFAQPGVNGSVVAFLCGGGDKPPCPADGTAVTGTIDAQDVVGPEDRGIAAGELEEFVAAIRAGATYANVHTELYPEGEIRGQLVPVPKEGETPQIPGTPVPPTPETAPPGAPTPAPPQPSQPSPTPAPGY